MLDKLNADADVDVKYFAQEALTGNNEGAESLYLIILFFFFIYDGISALVIQTWFCEGSSGTLRDVGCFLRLSQRPLNCFASDCNDHMETNLTLTSYPTSASGIIVLILNFGNRC